MSTKPHRQDVITETRIGATMILDGFDMLTGSKNSWDNGIAAQIVDATGSDPEAVGYKANDFAGENQGLMKADINQALGTAYTALLAFVQSASGKKLEDIRK
jgi:hypothetical protein